MIKQQPNYWHISFISLILSAQVVALGGAQSAPASALSTPAAPATSETQTVNSTSTLKLVPVYQSSKFPTFQTWQAAIQQLPAFQAKYSAAVKNKAYSYKTLHNYRYSAFAINSAKKIDAKANPCDVTELANAIQAYFQLENNGPLSVAGNWVDGQKPPQSFFDPSQAYFTKPAGPFLPFAQKLQLPTGYTVILRADVHGDAIALVAQLAYLQKQGYLDANDGFKLANAKTYMLFLGDYADRGLYGAEVLYTVLRLKLANPTQVFMVRGNHEDFKMAAKQGFATELQAKFGQLDFSEIYRIYEYLPAVIYLGCGNDYYQCCHGGLEIGYDPTDLLAAGAAANSTAQPVLAYQLLGALNQLDFLEKHDSAIGRFFKTSPEPDEEEETGAAAYATAFANFMPAAPVGLDGRLVGFMQHDFLVPDDTTAEQIATLAADKQNQKSPTRDKSKKALKKLGIGSAVAALGQGPMCIAYRSNHRLVCSKAFTQQVLNAFSSGPNKIRAVIRGHQHGADPKDPMMAGMINNFGVFSLWPTQPQASQGVIRPMRDYLVHTFLVAPDNNYGVLNSFNFDTFAILPLVDYKQAQLQILNTGIGPSTAKTSKSAKVAPSK